MNEIDAKKDIGKISYAIPAITMQYKKNSQAIA